MSQKGLAPILIVFLIALAAGGYLIYTNYSNNRYKAVSVKPTAQPTPAPASKNESSGSTETANPDSIGTDWKTYQSKNAGYAFKYPSDWTFVPVSEGCGPVFYPPNTKKVWLTVCGPYVNSDDSPENLAERSVDQKREVLKEAVVVDERQGVRQELLIEQPSYNYEIAVYLGKVQVARRETGSQSDKLGTLGVYYYIQDQSNLDKTKEQFNQILSTFRFDSLP